MRTILVTGGTGSLGSKVVEQLAEQQFNVRVATRNPEKVKEQENITANYFNYENPSSFSPAMKNVSGVFLVAPPMGPLADQKLIPLVEKAVEYGVEQFVLTSSLGMDQNPEAALAKIEKYLQTTGAQITILRPNFFMDNFTTGFVAPMIEHQNGIFVAADNAKTSFISCQDIAAVAVAAFKNPEVNTGQAYNLTGPEALDRYEIAAIISQVIGKEVSYVPISNEEMCKGALDNGMPEPMVEMMSALYSAVRAGYTAIVTNDFEKVMGSTPVCFKDYISK